MDASDDSRHSDGDPGAAVSPDGNRMGVRLWGEHDIATANIVGNALVEAIGSGTTDVVVDLADVTFLDASIVRHFIRARDLLAARDHHLSVRSPRRAVRRVLDLCDLTALIEPALIEPALIERGARQTADLPRPHSAIETWVDIPPNRQVPSSASSAAEPEPQPSDPAPTDLNTPRR